jgi:hypothetical protein
MGVRDMWRPARDADRYLVRRQQPGDVVVRSAPRRCATGTRLAPTPALAGQHLTTEQVRGWCRGKDLCRNMEMQTEVIDVVCAALVQLG